MNASRSLSLLLAALVVLGVSEAGASPAPQSEPSERERAPETRLFAYRDDELLFPWQRQSSAVYVPASVEPGARVPVVVLLHGTNGDGVKHLWLGGGSRDLRPRIEALSGLVEGGVVVAAPSQSRNASMGTRLWTGFDQAAFVKAAQQALGSRAILDTERVIVVGHSGAGCNPNGGLVSVAQGATAPMALISVDTCMDAELGKALAARPPQERLWVFWQDRSWPRQAEAFRKAIEEHQAPGAWFKMDLIDTKERNPHDAILSIAFGHFIPELLGKPAQDGGKA